MKVDANISKIYPTRRGTSQKGNAYCMTDMRINWTAKDPGCKEQVYNAVVTISGEPDMELLNSAVNNNKVLTMSLFFDVHEWKDDRAQTQIRAYLPDGYVKPL